VSRTPRSPRAPNVSLTERARGFKISCLWANDQIFGALEPEYNRSSTVTYSTVSVLPTPIPTSIFHSSGLSNLNHSDSGIEHADNRRNHRTRRNRGIAGPDVTCPCSQTSLRRRRFTTFLSCNPHGACGVCVTMEGSTTSTSTNTATGKSPRPTPTTRPLPPGTVLRVGPDGQSCKICTSFENRKPPASTKIKSPKTPVTAGKKSGSSDGRAAHSTLSCSLDANVDRHLLFLPNVGIFMGSPGD
jgi:hypothetical protein